MKSSTVMTIALAAASLIGAPVSFAAAHGAFYNGVDIVQVGDDSGNYLKISVPGNFLAAHGCEFQDAVRSKYPMSDARTQAWLDIALEAFRSQKRVYVRTNGCEKPLPNEGFPILVDFKLDRP